MKKVRLYFLPFLIYLMVTGSVTAHVQLDHPLGGETFVSGNMVNIQWSLLIPHDQQIATIAGVGPGEETAESHLKNA